MPIRRARTSKGVQALRQPPAWATFHVKPGQSLWPMTGPPLSIRHFCTLRLLPRVPALPTGMAAPLLGRSLRPRLPIWLVESAHARLRGVGVGCLSPPPPPGREPASPANGPARALDSAPKANRLRARGNDRSPASLAYRNAELILGGQLRRCVGAGALEERAVGDDPPSLAPVRRLSAPWVIGPATWSEPLQPSGTTFTSSHPRSPSAPKVAAMS